jgi:hypothetical protein
MKKHILFVFALFALLPQAEGGEKFVTSADCRGWFEIWAKDSKAALIGESAAAQAIKLDTRPVAEVGLPFDAVLKGAVSLCGRLDSQKVKLANPGIATTPTQICVDAFKKWEDEMDTAYAMAMFENKLPDDNKEFVSAQDVARREARIAKGFCEVLDRLH